MYVLVVFFFDDYGNEYEQVYGLFTSRVEAKSYADEKNFVEMEEFSHYKINVLIK